MCTKQNFDDTDSKTNVGDSSSDDNENVGYQKLYSQPPSILENASCLSKFIFTWPYKLLKIGLERPLGERDLPEISEVDSSKFQRNLFERIGEADYRTIKMI